MRPIVRPLILLVVIVMAAVSGCGASPEKTGTGPVYVALGDSYTAGSGIAPLADLPCGRSEINYPSLVAKALDVARFSDRSCGGASTLSLEEPQQNQVAQINTPQLDAVTEDTELVTIGMGLNNHGLALGLLAVCLDLDGGGPIPQCEKYMSLPESTIETQLKAAAAEVRAAIEDIVRKAPEARIVLVGYPRWVPDTGGCPDRLPVPDAHLDRMRNAMRVANEAWRKAAEQAGASYVDMYTPSQGHDICSDDPWVGDARGVPGKAAALHPFASYAKAVAGEVLDVLER